MVEIISSTFELVNFEMPERFPSGDTKEALQDWSSEVRSVWRYIPGSREQMGGS